VAANASVAQAEEQVTNEEFGATITMPTGWEQVEGNERALFNFRDAATFSQIEVIRAELVTAEVASVFFDTFHETLVGSEFVESGRQEATYGELAGTQTLYTFEHAGVSLNVTVFQFTRDTVAWLVIGYMQQSVADQQTPVFASVVESLSFGS
jgi:hypothetical protein